MTDRYNLTSQPLSILAFGAGAVGAYVTGSLVLHGHRVVFLERPETAVALRRRGLRLEINGRQEHIPNPAACASLEDALSQGPFDGCVFALKSFDTTPALDAITPYKEQMPPVLCLQNGVENEALLARVLGDGRVIPGTVASAVGKRAAGDVVLQRLRGVGIAEGHPLSIPLADAMNQAGLNARLYRRAADMKWSKLLTNLLANATSAILDMAPAEIFSHAGLYRLEIAQMREALAVMAAQGWKPVNLPRTPVRGLAFAARYLPLRLSRPLLARSIAGGRGQKMPSFHIDLNSGRGKSEVDYLNGAVVRFGEKSAIPTPVNRTLRDTLLALTAGEMARQSFARRPEELLEAVQEQMG